uniref:C2H2-type domain-containing protein n=1 Tax=Acanthochromis polyacanthus TaxID=80966 RepID=A0A3Q1EXZ1_9TELE
MRKYPSVSNSSRRLAVLSRLQLLVQVSAVIGPTIQTPTKRGVQRIKIPKPTSQTNLDLTGRKRRTTSTRSDEGATKKKTNSETKVSKTGREASLLQNKEGATSCSDSAQKKIHQDESIASSMDGNAAGKAKNHDNPYKCDICGKVKSNFKNYKFHMKSHTVEKTFKCHICGKKFRESWYLSNHIETHSAERPFPCDVCGKRFLRRYNLDLHLRVHTGERPFKCNHCGKSFSSPVNLKNCNWRQPL